MSTPLAIELTKVSKEYGTGDQAVRALDDLDLSVPERQFLSVMGASGSGKSTLLNVVAGLDVPTVGRVALFDRNLAELSDDARSRVRLEHVGFVFQSFNLFPTFTVRENVAWPLKFLGVGWNDAEERAAAVLQRVGVQSTAHGRRPNELSGGEQQRVAIARALVTEPRLLLADEPTGNLDSRTGESVLDLLRALNDERGLTVVLVTHSMVAARWGDRTIEMRDGAIVRDTATSRVDGTRLPGGS